MTPKTKTEIAEFVTSEIGAVKQDIERKFFVEIDINREKSKAEMKLTSATNDLSLQDLKHIQTAMVKIEELYTLNKLAQKLMPDMNEVNK